MNRLNLNEMTTLERLTGIYQFVYAFWYMSSNVYV